MGGVVTKQSGRNEPAQISIHESKQKTLEESLNDSSRRSGKDITEAYEFKDMIGEGSFAQVFLAESKDNHRASFKSKYEEDLPVQVAVKRIDKSGPMTKENIDLEIQLLTEAQHELVTRLYEFHENQEYYFLILESVTGGELFDYVIDNDFLSEREAASITLQLAKALNFLHSKCIVHRDVKPENILFESKLLGSKIKLTDFGLAAKVSKVGSKTLTSPCGTPGYVAPEILLRKPYGEKVDSWSIGVILYILLCGYPPFYSEDQSKLFSQIKAAQFDFSDAYWGSISDSAKELIAKIFVIEPDQRLDTNQIINHSWVKNAAEQSPDALGNHVVQGMKEVRKDERLKRVALAINVLTAFKATKNVNHLEKLNAKNQ